MTSQYKRHFSGLIASLCLFTYSFGQVSEITNLEWPGTCRNVEVYKNIKDEFEKQFERAENVRWSRVDKNFLANFSKHDQQYAVLFNPRAIEIYRIIYGKEKDLPFDIRRWVKRVYVEFNIASAINIKEAGRNIWLINVADDSEFAWVKIENDEIREVEKYKKYIPISVKSSGLAKSLD